MMYNEQIKQQILDSLIARGSSISNCIIALNNEGFIPNNKKYRILDWTCMLIDGYNSIEILTEEQQDKLDKIFNTVMNL